MAKNPSRSPSEVRSLKQAASLKQDSSWDGNWWMLTDGRQVTISDQAEGMKPRQQIGIPVDQFNRFVKWWMKKQPIHK